MHKSVHTFRLSTPTLPAPVNIKRLSRTGSSLSGSSSTINRLSCAPDESATLSLALQQKSPAPVATNPKAPSSLNFNSRQASTQQNRRKVAEATPSVDDHLYEEINSVYRSPSSTISPPENNPSVIKRNYRCHASTLSPGDNSKRNSYCPSSTHLSFPVTGRGSKMSTSTSVLTAPISSQTTSSVNPPPDPPKLAPVSGVLHNQSPALIRPIAFRPYIRTPIDIDQDLDDVVAPLTSPKPSLSHSSTKPTAESVSNGHLSRKPTGRSLSDPWKGSGNRKAIAPFGASSSDFKSRSTPSSVKEETGSQHVYYPSSSDKSSYGYVSCSDQSVESLYNATSGTPRTYHARMIGSTDEEAFNLDEGYHVISTPSPSDSGIAINYEALLRDRDNEIIALRKTMELNENVIFRVHEEKEAAWRRQNESIKQHYEGLLEKQRKEQDQRVAELTRTIEELRGQSVKLQTQVQTAMNSKIDMESSIQQLEKQCQDAQIRLDEANWSVGDKNGQLALLKKSTRTADNEATCQQVTILQQKLEAAQKEALQRNAELKDLRQTLNFLSQELYQVQQKFDATREELDTRRDSGAASKSNRESIVANLCESLDYMDMERLKKEMADMKAKYNTEKRTFEEERATWFEEKEKVVKYQKQLQLNYLEIYKRNCSLEAQLDDVTASLRLNGHDDSRPNSVRESDC
ncbi:hypothetical protein RvY_04616 [Ramazzottius varieornatus]|uniref:Uncharacterized protein n=1 Tax=Ramazzottius varieornatus TaxID=947166 RepID=A0A1D1US71_RAMVA|nr:hypothetical protein RvY_04616 [Ramazzottius varieornatus]